MKPLSDYMGEKLVFGQPNAFKRLHELKVNEEVIATMQQKGFFGMTWVVSIQNKTWEIYRASFWKSAIDIREAGYEMPIASFVRTRFRSKGTVSFPKGEILKIEPHLFKGFCEIINIQEECIARIKPKTALKDKAEVMIEKKTELLDRYPWVLILAYIIILEQKRQARHSA